MLFGQPARGQAQTRVVTMNPGGGQKADKNREVNSRTRINTSVLHTNKKVCKTSPQVRDRYSKDRENTKSEA